MGTQILHASAIPAAPLETAPTGDGFRTVPIDQLWESPTNPRRHFEALEDLAASIKEHGVIVRLLVRPIEVRPVPPAEAALEDLGLLAEPGYEIVDGARRYRAAQKAGLAVLPVEVRAMSDEQVLETQIVANLQREGVHPLDEGLGYRTLMERAGLDVAAIAAKVGKSQSYVYQRLKLAELIPDAQEKFLANEISAGHAILIARLQNKEQQRALNEISLRSRFAPMSVRELASWIQTEVHLELKRAPFAIDSAELVPAAGACSGCQKRSANNRALYADVEADVCTDPTCYNGKVAAHLKITEAKLAGKGEEVVKVTSSWNSKPKAGVLGLDRYDLARDGEKGPAIKTALVVDGPDRGKVVKVRIRQEQPRPSGQSPQQLAEQRKREEEGLARERGIRMKILDAIAAKAQWPPDRYAIQELIMAAVRGSDSVEPLAERLGLNKSRPHPLQWHQAEEAIEKKLGTLTGVELGRVVVELPLLEQADLQYTNGSDDQLVDAAKHYKVDAAKIRIQIAGAKKPAPAAGAKGKKR